MESYSIMNMSCKSAVLKKSSSKWLSFGKLLIPHLKRTIFAFMCLCSPGRAETPVIWGGKTNDRLIAFFLSNISCQKLAKSVDVRRRYSVQHQWRFLRHRVQTEYTHGSLQPSSSLQELAYMSYWIKQNNGDIPTISVKIFEEVLVRRMRLKRHDFEQWESFQELRAIDIPMAYFMRVPCTLIRLLISLL